MKRFCVITLVSLLALCAHAQKSSLWKYMGTRKDLRFVKGNVQRTGAVTKVYYEKDGDLHVWMRSRIGAKDSTYTVEIVCYSQRPQCGGYKSPLKKPQVGKRYRVTGDLVWDDRHNWYEIHPVRTLTPL